MNFVWVVQIWAFLSSKLLIHQNGVHSFFILIFKDTDGTQHTCKLCNQNYFSDFNAPGHCSHLGILILF